MADAPLIQPSDLVQCPTEATSQAFNNGFQVSDERLNVVTENLRVRNAGVRLRPALPEHLLYAYGQVLGIAFHQVS